MQGNLCCPAEVLSTNSLILIFDLWAVICNVLQFMDRSICCLSNVWSPNMMTLSGTKQDIYFVSKAGLTSDGILKPFQREHHCLLNNRKVACAAITQYCKS